MVLIMLYEVNWALHRARDGPRVQADLEWSEILVFATKICTRDILNYLFQLLLSSHHIYLTCNIYDERILLHEHLCLQYVIFAVLIAVHSIFPQPQIVLWNLPWDIRQKRMTHIILPGFLMESKEELPVNNSKPANIYLSPCLLFSSFDC